MQSLGAFPTPPAPSLEIAVSVLGCPLVVGLVLVLELSSARGASVLPLDTTPLLALDSAEEGSRGSETKKQK